MSLRQIAPVNFDRPDHVQPVLNDRAVKAWSDAPVRAAADDNVIAILEPIGVDFWTGEGVTAKSVGARLKALGGAPVRAQINSPGGDFFEGLAIYNQLSQYEGEVTVEILALAASAAAVIAMAGDKIVIAKAGMLMIHNTQWISLGDRHAMRETADIMEKFDAVAGDLFADRTGKTSAAMGKLLDAETWLTGKEAVSEGFADELMGAEPKRASGAKNSILYRIESALTPHMPRSQVRDLMKAVKDEIGATPSADPHGKPGAADPADTDELLSALRSFKL